MAPRLAGQRTPRRLAPTGERRVGAASDCLLLTEADAESSAGGIAAVVATSVLSSSSSEEQLQVHGPLSSDGQSFSGIGGGRLADIGESGTSLAGEHGTCGVSRGFPSASLSAVSMAGVAHVALSVEAMMAAVLIVLIAIVLGLRCPCRLAPQQLTLTF